MTEPVDYTGYALYREAVDAFGDPVFARWICRGYPWGGVDLNRAHEGFLLARDGVAVTGGDARIVLSLLIREVTTLEHRIGHEGQAAVLGPAARALRRLMTDIRRLANAHPAHAEFRLRCPCSVGDGEFSGAHDDPLPQADPPAALTLRSAAKQVAGARNASADLDRDEALDGALGLVRLALYQLGSAEGEATSPARRGGTRSRPRPKEQAGKPARLRKPNRVTASRRAVLNGARISHASMPRARGRWRPDPARDQDGAPGRGQTASPSEGKPREAS